jgi:flavorubredoxin
VVSDPISAFVPSTLPRQIAPGVCWLGACSGLTLNGQELHGHLSAFLVLGAAATAMVDTGSPQTWDAVEAQLEECLGERPLDYVVPTHSELPHGGNLARVLARYPGAVAVGDLRDYHLFYPEVAARFRPMPAGSVLDLGGGYRLELVPALIRDMPSTIWAYESSQQVLFASDGFAYLHHPEAAEAGPVHAPGECGRLTSELGAPPSVDAAAFFSSAALYWTRFVDNADELFARVEDLLATHPARIVAPGHGNVIDEVAVVLPVLKEAHRRSVRTRKA